MIESKHRTIKEIAHHCLDCEKYWGVEMNIVGEEGDLIRLKMYKGADTSLCPYCNSRNTETLLNG